MLLAAYHAAEQQRSQPRITSLSSDAAAPDEEDDTRWIPRLMDSPGLPADRVAPLHGQLIAHGLLRFQLLSRTAGIGYRVTPEGRAALEAAHAALQPVADC